MANARGTAPSPGVARWTLLALFGMNMLNFIDRYILAAVLRPISADLNLDRTQAGWVISVFFIAYVVFSPVIGWLGDRMRRKYLLAAAVALWSLATFGTGLSTSFGQILLARALLAIGEATYATLAPTLIADLFPREKRNRAVSYFYLALPFGAALGYTLGGALHEWYGWRAAFQIVGLPGLAVAAAALFLREPKRGATEAVEQEVLLHQEALPVSWSVYRSLATNRSFLFNTLGMAMFTFALGGLQAWAPTYFSEAFTAGTNPSAQELDQALTSANFWLGVTVAVGALVGTPLGGFVADRLNRWRRGAYFWFSGVTMFAALPLFVVVLLSHSPVVIYSVLVVALTLTFVNIGPSNAILTNVTVPKIRAGAIAVNLVVIHVLGDIPSPPLMGLVSDAAGMFWGMAITLPAVFLSGVFFCLGTPFLEADQEQVLKDMRGEK